MVSIGGFVLCSPDQNSDLSPVYENEALALVGHVGAHSTPNDAVPGRQVHSVEFSFDYLCNVVQDFLLSERKRHTIHCVLLHSLAHVCEFYD